MIYRGVDGRTIFADDQDRVRFVHDLYEFNDTKPADIYTRTPAARGALSSHDVGHDMSYIPPKRDRIVDLHGWKFMPNHTHLLLSERVANGLSLFLRKMRGYGRYFNERHGRHGRLFDTTKKVLIKQPAHFLYVLHYLHLNGLDDLPGAEGWRERDKGTIANVDAAIAHLKADKWSSIRDYCGEKNFPSILTTDLFAEHPGEYEQDIRRFLKERARFEFDNRLFE